MKKNLNLKKFALGLVVCFLASTLVVPTFAASLTKSAQLVYNNIKISLDGRQLTPQDVDGNTVEPFIIDGTTYLPVRAISSSLGMNVDWDSSTNTVLLFSGNDNDQNDSIYFVQLLGYFEIIRDELDALETEFSVMRDDIQWIMDETFTDEPYAGRTLCSVSIELNQNALALVEGHYNNCKFMLSDEGVDLWYEYKRLANLAISYYKQLDTNPDPSYIDRVVGASTDNMASCYMAKTKAENMFWEAYQAAF